MHLIGLVSSITIVLVFLLRLTQGDEVLPTCQDVYTISDFNITKFMDGKEWNTIERTNNSYEGDACNKLSFQNNKDTFFISIGGTPKYFGQMDSAGNLTVQFDPVPERMQSFSIVATDYEEYAILYSCLDSRSTGFTENVWALSKSNELWSSQPSRWEQWPYFRTLLDQRGLCASASNSSESSTSTITSTENSSSASTSTEYHSSALTTDFTESPTTVATHNLHGFHIENSNKTFYFLSEVEIAL